MGLVSLNACNGYARFLPVLGLLKIVNCALQNIQGELILQVPAYAEKGSNVTMKCTWKECGRAQGCGKDDWDLNYETPLEGIIFFCGVNCKIPWNKSKFQCDASFIFGTKWASINLCGR